MLQWYKHGMLTARLRWSFEVFGDARTSLIQVNCAVLVVLLVHHALTCRETRLWLTAVLTKAGYVHCTCMAIMWQFV